MPKSSTVVIVLNVLILGALVLWCVVSPSWRYVPSHVEPEPQQHQQEEEKEPEMRPAETVQVQVQYGDNLVEFDVVLGEREKKDILPPIHYNNKQFEEDMIFDCEGKKAVVLFTDCILCSPSFRNCQNASLVMYRNKVYSRTWDSFILSEAHLPDFYTLTLTDNSFIVRPCPLDETKEFVHGRRGESNPIPFEFGPEPKGGIIKQKEAECCKEDEDGVVKCTYPFLDSFDTFKFQTGLNFYTIKIDFDAEEGCDSKWVIVPAEEDELKL